MSAFDNNSSRFTRSSKLKPRIVHTYSLRSRKRRREANIKSSLINKDSSHSNKLISENDMVNYDSLEHASKKRRLNSRYIFFIFETRFCRHVHVFLHSAELKIRQNTRRTKRIPCQARDCPNRSKYYCIGCTRGENWVAFVERKLVKENVL